MKENNNLAHYGILGMKWGIRRYQNKDGSLTAAGKKRVGDTKKNDALYNNIGTGLQSGSNAARTAANLNRQAGERRRKKAESAMDLSSMSDKELRASIDRMNMERAYKQLKSSEITTGSEYVSSLLSTTGDVLAIGASAASIALAIHKIRG